MCLVGCCSTQLQHCAHCRPTLGSIVYGHSYSICDILWTISHSHVSENTRPHLYLQHRKPGWCEKNSVHTMCREDGWRISHNWLLTTVSNSKESHQTSFKLDGSVLVQQGCRDTSGRMDSKRCHWEPVPCWEMCQMLPSIETGGALLAGTGNQGSWVCCNVQDITQMELFSWLSTSLV